MSPILDVEDIRALVPHRYPMLLVDRITELEVGKRVVGLKNVTINEPFFDGHFPGQAVMPGVLIIESMAQVAGLMLLAHPAHEGKLAFIAAMDKSRFRQPVVPGDQMIITAEMLWSRGMMGKVHMEARVEGSLVAECDMTFALKDPVSRDEIAGRAASVVRYPTKAPTETEGDHGSE